jgi:hyperosmotically inducible protein
LTNYAVAAGVTLALGAAPAWAQQGSTADADRPATTAARADDKARQATSSTGEKITDAWILTKVKSQFVGEDALEDSDINVDVRNNVVILKGTVASEAGKARAAEIARTTEGVTRVQNNLVVGVAKNRAGDPTVAKGTDSVAGDVREESREARDEAREAGRDMKEAGRDAKESAKDAAHDTKQAAKDASAEAREEGREAKRDAKETARDASRETSETVGTAGQAVNDGWITTKVKSSFVGVDVLDGSDIDVDTNNHVVTLRGTVASEAARTRAASLAKQVEGVKSVKNELKVGAKK